MFESGYPIKPRLVIYIDPFSSKIKYPFNKQGSLIMLTSYYSEDLHSWIMAKSISPFFSIPKTPFVHAGSCLWIPHAGPTKKQQVSWFHTVWFQHLQTFWWGIFSRFDTGKWLQPQWSSVIRHMRSCMPRWFYAVTPRDNSAAGRTVQDSGKPYVILSLSGEGCRIETWATSKPKASQTQKGALFSCKVWQECLSANKNVPQIALNQDSSKRQVCLQFRHAAQAIKGRRASITLQNWKILGVGGNPAHKLSQKPCVLEEFALDVESQIQVERTCQTLCILEPRLAIVLLSAWLI